MNSDHRQTVSLVYRIVNEMLLAVETQEASCKLTSRSLSAIEVARSSKFSLDHYCILHQGSKRRAVTTVDSRFPITLWYKQATEQHVYKGILLCCSMSRIPPPTPSSSRTTRTPSRKPSTPGLRAGTSTPVRKPSPSPTPPGRPQSTLRPQPSIKSLKSPSSSLRTPAKRAAKSPENTPDVPQVPSLSIREQIALRRAEAKKAEEKRALAKASPVGSGFSDFSGLEDALPTTLKKNAEDVSVTDLGRWSVKETIERGRSTGELVQCFFLPSS